MKTNKLLTMAMAAAILVGGFTSALAQNTDSSAGAGPGHGKMLHRLAQKLNLTDDQKKQIKAVLVADKGALKGLFSQLHEARQNLREAIQASDANEAAVRAASAKVAGVEADFAVERMKLYGRIAPILTDEQRRKLADFEQQVDNLAGGAMARSGETPAN